LSQAKKKKKRLFENKSKLYKIRLHRISFVGGNQNWSWILDTCHGSEDTVKFPKTGVPVLQHQKMEKKNTSAKRSQPLLHLLPLDSESKLK